MSSSGAPGKGYASVPLYFIYGFTVVMAYELILNSKKIQFRKNSIVQVHVVHYNETQC